MTIATQAKIWGIVLLVFVFILITLKAVLLPFVAGMAIAYFLDPTCDRLESWGCSRALATSIVTAVFGVSVILVLILIVPLGLSELLDFFASLPDYIAKIQERLLPAYERLRLEMDLPATSELSTIAQERLGSALGWLGSALQGLVDQGLALANMLSLIFITPVVAFYLLRDWDRMVARIDQLLPRDHALTIRAQVSLMDRSLAGFARGQAMVCIFLGAFYAIALTVISLPFGAVIGIIAGMLTFIPYVGSMTGLVLALAVSIAQFGDWTHIGITAAIFIVGQVLEGNFLTPKLVGDRVGLHPVWIVFALLAGGALFGFVGLLLAVPVAAVVAVLVRFSILQYLNSRLYLGTRQPVPVGPQSEAASEPTEPQS